MFTIEHVIIASTREISVVSARDICSDSEELQKVDSFSSHLTLGLW